MRSIHRTLPASCRPKHRSPAALILLLVVVLAAVAPAAAAPTPSIASTAPSSTVLKAAPAMMYQSGTNVTMFRWFSSGTSFTRYASHWTVPTGYNAGNVGDRMVSGDFNGDGTDDIATAYDYGTYFRFHVWLGGVDTQGTGGWYEAAINLDNVQGRLVAGDWDGDGIDDLALGYDYGNNTARIYRYRSTGSSFTHMAGDWVSNDGTYAFSQIGNRMVSGDFNGDGMDDIAFAYNYGTYFRFHVWLGGVDAQGTGGWYEGTLNLTNVRGRLVAGDWDGDGIDDLALGYDYGNSTARIYRYRSTCTNFTRMAGDWVSDTGGYALSNVGDRMAAGDVNGDGTDDIAFAYNYGTFFRFHVLLDGVTGSSAGWYEWTLNLTYVQNRFVLGRW